MSDQIIQTGEFGIGKYSDDRIFADVTAAGGWLPRLQLMGSNSDLVKEAKIGLGRWALLTNKDSFIDLGTETHVLILGWRPKAMEIGDEVVSVFNPKADEFKRIMEKSEEPDSGCMFGPEYLVWIPELKKFAGLFMASKTARREAPNLRALMGKFATLKARLIKSQRYSWHGPVVTPCSATFEVPTMEEIREQAEKFNNPPEDEVEAAPSGGEDRPR